MNKFYSFDKEGFWFSAKFLAVFFCMLAIFYFGSGSVFAKIFPQKFDISEIEENLENILARKKFEENMKKILASEKEVQDLFEKTRNIKIYSISDYIPREGKFIGVDLEEMKLYLYQNGEIDNTFEILSKGKEGTYYETPSGLYKIITKEKNHFSSIGYVFMPYSMQFFGNFYIHGWPYYPDGTPVRAGYSGGCIRLSDKDAQKVFDFSEKGTEIFVYEEKNDIVSEAVKLKNISKPEISAESFIVADIDSGEIFLEKNPEQILPIASISKLMTAIVANETISYDKKIINGETFSVGDLLYPLIMQSDNGVADSLAMFYGANAFVQWMNDKAKALSMDNTNFNDSSGLSSYNTSTVSDLFRLSRYLKNKRSFILNISKEPQKDIIASSGRDYKIINLNPFSENENFIGGKTGYTETAGETMLSTFSVPIGQEENVNLAIIVLGSEGRQKDTLALLDWFKKARVCDEEIVLGFTGDIMLNRGVENVIKKYGNNDFSFPFKFVSEKLNEFDLLFGNLEGPISDKGEDLGSSYSFRMDTRVASALNSAGFDIVSLANNHIGDWGQEAMIDTLSWLKKENIAGVGLGLNEAEAYNYKILETKGIEIAFLAFSDFGNNYLEAKGDNSGIAIINSEKMKTAVKKAEENSDLVVVSLHFGNEYEIEPNYSQKNISRQAIDWGANLVVGHHPHILQPIEKYKNGYIAYSLGNFVFDQDFAKETNHGGILKVIIKDKEISEVSLIDTYINNLFQVEIK
ncbi:CapA family protein [Patescibacteria group bacterium]|nr:CapA family protein [Patescibacteria group bacterium]